MREIKFRAWVKPLKRYANGIDTILYHKASDVEGGGIWSVVCEEWDSEVYECDNIVVEQYTGLKDKNGKEIYEGDIVTETIDDGDNKIIQIYEVYWDEDMLNFGIRGTKGFNYNLHDELWETNASREVIGNIHENPELLEDKNGKN